MSIEKRDLLEMFRDSAGCKTWYAYAKKLGLDYHQFMNYYYKGEVSPAMIRAMSKLHGLDLSFLEKDNIKYV